MSQLTGKVGQAVTRIVSRQPLLLTAQSRGFRPAGTVLMNKSRSSLQNGLNDIPIDAPKTGFGARHSNQAQNRNEAQFPGRQNEDQKDPLQDNVLHVGRDQGKGSAANKDSWSSTDSMSGSDWKVSQPSGRDGDSVKQDTGRNSWETTASQQADRSGKAKSSGSQFRDKDSLKKDNSKFGSGSRSMSTSKWDESRSQPQSQSDEDFQGGRGFGGSMLGTSPGGSASMASGTPDYGGSIGRTARSDREGGITQADQRDASSAMRQGVFKDQDRASSPRYTGPNQWDVTHNQSAVERTDTTRHGAGGDRSTVDAALGRRKSDSSGSDYAGNSHSRSGRSSRDMDSSIRGGNAETWKGRRSYGSAPGRKPEDLAKFEQSNSEERGAFKYEGYMPQTSNALNNATGWKDAQDRDNDLNPDSQQPKRRDQEWDPERTSREDKRSGFDASDRGILGGGSQRNIKDTGMGGGAGDRRGQGEVKSANAYGSRKFSTSGKSYGDKPHAGLDSVKFDSKKSTSSRRSQSSAQQDDSSFGANQQASQLASNKNQDFHAGPEQESGLGRNFTQTKTYRNYDAAAKHDFAHAKGGSRSGSHKNDQTDLGGSGFGANQKFDGIENSSDRGSQDVFSNKSSSERSGSNSFSASTSGGKMDDQALKDLYNVDKDSHLRGRNNPGQSAQSEAAGGSEAKYDGAARRANVGSESLKGSPGIQSSEQAPGRDVDAFDSSIGFEQKPNKTRPTKGGDTDHEPYSTFGRK